MGSSRLPKKVMKEVLGRPMIGFLLERLSKSNKLDQIVLATSKKSLDRVLASYVKKLGFPVILGSENDVLDRYYRAAKEFKPNKRSTSKKDSLSSHMFLENLKASSNFPSKTSV